MEWTLLLWWTAYSAMTGGILLMMNEFDLNSIGSILYFIGTWTNAFVWIFVLMCIIYAIWDKFIDKAEIMRDFLMKYLKYLFEQ